MTKENMQRIHRIFSILLSIVIVIAGLCFIVACVDIYQSGEQPFSREAVAKAFKPIAIPVYLCLILTIVGFIWELISPLRIKKAKSDKAYGTILNHLHEKHDVNKCDSALHDAIIAEQKKRRQANIISTVIICVVSAIFLFYACNNSNFDKTDINGSMIKAMGVLIPCLVIAFVCGIFSIVNNEKSTKCEIELIKKAPPADTSLSDSGKADKSSRKLVVLRVVVLVVAVALILIGYFSDGTADVLTKAINICTECIGLG